MRIKCTQEQKLVESNKGLFYISDLHTLFINSKNKKNIIYFHIESIKTKKMEKNVFISLLINSNESHYFSTLSEYIEFYNTEIK